MDNYFKPNWRDINKAINEGRYKEVKAALGAIKLTILKRYEEYEAREKEKADRIHIADLKELPTSSPLYYVGRYRNSGIGFIYGAKLVKTGHGRKYVYCTVASTGKTYSVPFSEVATTAPSEKSVADQRLMESILRW